MRCPVCQTLNPSAARHCFHCGTMLVNGVVCRTCYTLLPGDARFCFHCGDMVIGAAVNATLLAAPAQAAIIPASAPRIQPAIIPAPAADGAALRPSPVRSDASLPAPRPYREMLESLRRYLPLAQFEPFERRPNARNLSEARDHLTALLTTVRTYLPRPVVMQPQPPGEPRGEMLRGVFLFVDVSGFTPLSEKLRPLGRIGAERIVSIINAMFSELVRVLFDHGGILLKFGGDALLGLFPGDTDAAMAESALHAIQTGLAMQAIMGQFSAIEAAGEMRALQIKCGISSGAYFAAHIGSAANMAYVTTGHTVNDAEGAQNQAEPGQVVVTASTHALLGDSARGIESEAREAGYFLIRAAPPVQGDLRAELPDEPPGGETDAQITYLVARLDRLTPYLPDELISRIVTNPEDARIAPDHRPVTVMFANYLGISDLIDDLGETQPDTITYHLNRYFVHMAAIVERYEGTVSRMDQYAVGDRLIIFFGAPRAHEDDPIRAVYTALEMQAAMREFAALRTATGVYRFQQRIGINTGALFAGNVGAADLRQEYTLMGDDINLAARLMSKGDWGKILISRLTQTRAGSLFETTALGELKVKGKQKPVMTYEVVGVRRTDTASAGTPGSAGANAAPLIGREAAVWTLLNCARGLLGGRGQIAVVIGEGGLGKTRLLHAFEARFASDITASDGGADKARWIEAQALSFSESISYWLAASLFRSALGLNPVASKDDALYRLWERSEGLLGKETAREATPFLAYIMGLELEGEWAKLVNDLDPQVRQKQILWAAREFFIHLARESFAHGQPMIVLLDDLHYSDEASLAVIDSLFEVSTQVPLLLVMAFRPKHDKGVWRLKDRADSEYQHRYTEVALAPLPQTDSTSLLAALLPGAVFSPPSQAEILAKAAGNPFYLGEIVRSLIDSGSVVADTSVVDNSVAASSVAGSAGAWRVTAEIDRIAIPDTLQGAIIARLDRLTEDARQALQMAAVVGRRFQTELVRSMAEVQVEVRAELSAWLSQLERSNLIQPTDIVGVDQFYVFLDALVQEVAYENLLTGRRQVFHRRVAEKLESLLGDRVEQEGELLAYHFGLSDDRDKAIHYLDMAARRAQLEFANETAARHCGELLALLGDGEATWQRQFEVRQRRQAVFGLLGKPEDRHADLEAMMALAVAHQDESRRADVLNHLADLFQWTGRYDEAEAAAKEALVIKTALDDSAGRAQSLHQLGVLAYYRGKYDEAEPVLAQAVKLREGSDNPEGEAWSVMYLGMIEYAHGSYHDAAEHHQYALRLAQARGDMFQIGIHLTNAARVDLRLGEYQQALDEFQQSLEMKRRVGDQIGQGFSLFSIGMTYHALERYDEAEQSFQASLELRQRIEDERGVAYAVYGLGLVALGRGQYQQAVEHFTRAVAMSRALGLRAEVIAHLSSLGQAYLALGQHAPALTASREAMELLLAQIDVQEEQQMYLNHYRVLIALGDPAAQEYLQLAYDEIMKQAARVGSDEARAKFLRQSRVNQEILAAFERGSAP